MFWENQILYPDSSIKGIVLRKLNTISRQQHSRDCFEKNKIHYNQAAAFKRLFRENHAVVGDFINTMKTTFDSNFDLYQAFKKWIYINIEVKRIGQIKKLIFDYLKKWHLHSSLYWDNRLPLYIRALFQSLRDCSPF